MGQPFMVKPQSEGFLQDGKGTQNKGKPDIHASVNCL
jgi:hypothetical protein